MYLLFPCHRYPDLCILAVPDDSQTPVGCVVGKVDDEKVVMDDVEVVCRTGYIGMLAVQQDFRRKGIGKAVVKRVLKRMMERGCTSVTLETEVSNTTAQKLYVNAFGFIREQKLVRYYLNWGDAYLLRLWFPKKDDADQES